MTDPQVRTALLEYVTAGEPPLGLTMDGVVRAGRRSRRIRRVLWGGGTFGLSAAIVLASSLLTGGSPVPTIPAPGSTAQVRAPDAATCEELRTTPITANATDQERADRMSCYLLAAVPAALPGASFADNPARKAPFLVAAPGSGGMPDGLSATATVSTSEGDGLVIFEVGRSKPLTEGEKIGHCDKADCLVGPHGEHIEVFDFGADPATGAHGVTVYVYTANTLVLAGAHNAPEIQNAAPTMPQPPLTIAQLITLATDPGLVLFP
jgi:hypothetical protein